MRLIVYLCCGLFIRSFVSRQQHSEVQGMRSVTPPFPRSFSQSNSGEATLPPRSPHVLLFLFIFILLFLHMHVGLLLVMKVQPVCFTLLPPSALHRYVTFCSRSIPGSGILSGTGTGFGSTSVYFQLVVFLLQVWSSTPG